MDPPSRINAFQFLAVCSVITSVFVSGVVFAGGGDGSNTLVSSSILTTGTGSLTLILCPHLQRIVLPTQWDGTSSGFAHFGHVTAGILSPLSWFGIISPPRFLVNTAPEKPVG